MSTRIARALLSLGFGLLGATLSSAAPPSTPSNVNIDVLVVHTAGASALYSGGVGTRVNHMLNVTNQIYADSEIGITLRLVQTNAVVYSDTVTSNTALSAFKQNAAPAFTNVEAWRTQYGADMVILLRPYCGDGIAGLGYVGGIGSQGDLASSKPWMYTHVAINTGDYVLAHELGHNMGLVHSRKQDPAGGTWSYSAGYGLQGVLVDVMAYTSAFGVNDAQKVYQFSNPLHSVNGHALGVSQSNATQGADAVASLNAVRASVSAFFPSRQVVASRVGEFGGDTRSDLFRSDPDDGKNYLWITGTCSAPADGFGVDLLASCAPTLALTSSGDYDGDGNSDVFFRGSDNASVGWLLGVGAPRVAPYPSVVGTYWQVAGSGDLDGDGDDDVVWRNYLDGTNKVWLMNGAGAPTVLALSSVPDVKWRIDTLGDFDGDGKQDLFWRNYTSGKNTVWLMNGATTKATGVLTPRADLGWKAVGTGDFDGDGDDDVLFNHAVTGANSIGYMSGTALSGTVSIAAQSSTAWKCSGIGDFDGDGHRDDIVWRDSVNEEDIVWTMSGTTPISERSLKTGRELLESVGALADLDGDGHSELVWRNPSSGADTAWFMNGTTRSSASATDAQAGSTLRIIRAGDFDGDAKQDLLWRDSANGQVRVWLMNGTSVVSKSTIATVADANNAIVRVADLNGDGKDDIVLRHALSGVNTLWLMNGGAIGSTLALPLVADLNWKLSAAGDMNGDGKDDLVWRHSVSGSNQIWLMNGATRTSSIALTAVADPQWKIFAAADFDGDGSKDLLWRNGANGKNTLWLMNGTSVRSVSPSTALADVKWVVEGVGDFDADGRADILWRHGDTLARRVWLMNGASVASSAAIY